MKMLAPKAHSDLRLVPPPGVKPTRQCGVRMGKVKIGKLYAPGTHVRLPAHGIFYEVAPADHGREADWLQAMLMSDALPHSTPSRGTTERLVRRVLSMCDRAYFAFVRNLGVVR